MSYLWLNAGAIALATLVALLVAGLWLRLVGPRVAWQAGLWLTAALAAGWLAAILAGALILAPEEAPRAVMVVGSPIVIWAGFVLPAVVLAHRLRGLPWRAALADALLWLAMMVAMALVLEAVGLVPPPR